jgi:hypothetical protein
MSETKTNVLVIELVNQQPSSFVLDGIGVGPDDQELQTNISAPNARKLKNKSSYVKVVTENGKEVRKLVRTRYIKGCDVIEIEEQKRQGFEPSPINDVIWILNGKRVVLESEGEIGLYKFLQMHEGNVSNAHRPENAQDIFKEVNTAVQAKEEELLIDMEMQGMTYLNTLKRKKSGTDIWSYNNEAIEFLCSYFKIPMEKDNPSEAWVALVYELKSNPKRFLESAISFVKVIETEVAQALAKGLIIEKSGMLVFANGEKPLLESSEKWSSDDKQNALVEYFTDEENKEEYRQLRSDLFQNKSSSTGVLL